MKRARVLLLAAAWLCLAGAALAEDRTGTVVSVHDGDTMRVRIDCAACADRGRVRRVRLRKVDAPELRDRRPGYARLAVEARDALAALCPVGSVVALRHVGSDKYRRVLARVECSGVDAAKALQAQGLARAWSGRGPKPW